LIWLNQFIPILRHWQIDIHSHNLRGISQQKKHLEDSLLDYGDPVFTDDVASSNYPVFKGPATL
jgi:hypothetical protein